MHAHANPPASPHAPAATPHLPFRITRGVLNVVHGTHDVVNAILDHPDIRAVSFVGSDAAGRHVYSRAAASGKRVQVGGVPVPTRLGLCFATPRASHVQLHGQSVQCTRLVSL